MARNISRFEAELAKHEEPDWLAVIKELVSKTILKKRGNMVHPEDRRSKTTLREWKDLVRSCYNSYYPKDSRKIWCPTMQRYFYTGPYVKYSKTAHIVPHSFGYKNMGHTFGEPERGMELMWSSGKRIPKFSFLESSFDEGRWTMTGHPQDGGRPIE